MHNPVWCRKLIKRQLLPVPRSIHYLSSYDIINSGRTTATNLNRIESCAYREAVLIKRSLAFDIIKVCLFIISARLISSLLPSLYSFLPSPGNSFAQKLSRYIPYGLLITFLSCTVRMHGKASFTETVLVPFKFWEQCSQTILFNVSN